MCNCNKETHIGNYGNQTTILPHWSNRFICVDTCLLPELCDLWSQGVITTGCCCGHGTAYAYIGVKEEFIPLMKELGYKVFPNQYDSTREDSFYPKTIKT